jgi:hypothetical protein
MLDEGRERASHQRRNRRLLAGAGLSGGVLALAASRSRALTRRRLLCRLLAAGGVLSLGSGLAASALAELAGAEELRAFEAVTRRLEAFDLAPRGRARMALCPQRSS